jgi:hypothetical protein
MGKRPQRWATDRREIGVPLALLVGLDMGAARGRELSQLVEIERLVVEAAKRALGRNN